MNAYQVSTYDQVHANWLLFDLIEEGSISRIKPQYAHLYCPKCFKPHHEKAFEFGFAAGAKFRVRGQIQTTLDGFLCVHDVVRALMEKHKWSGLALKEVPGAPWHVVNVTERVWANAACFTSSGFKCEVCGRVREVTGSVMRMISIAIPSTPGTFFTPTIDRAGSTNGERDVFITEDIYQCLKTERIKGACFSRLMDAKAVERNQRKWQKLKQAV